MSIASRRITKFISISIILTLLLAIPDIQLTGKARNYESEVQNLPRSAHHDYDVIVIGGEPEGVAAAVAAARNGAKTLLVEQRNGLGGLLTYGYLNQLDIGYERHRRLANQGIFLEWYKMIGRKGTFDVPLAKQKFRELVQEEKNLTLLLNTRVEEVLKEGRTVTGIRLKTPNGMKQYSAKRFIDSTADADFAAQAGAPYYIGQEDMGMPDKKMAVTLVMLFKQVDWGKLKKAGNQKVLGGAKVYRNIAHGFPEVATKYKPVESNTRVRGLNIGMQSDGLVTINALQIFDVDGLDPASVREGIDRGKREIQHFVQFLRKELPGFEKAEIAGYPTELYVRETRHIKAEYQLNMIDVWENRDQWDSIGLGAYPVDVQATELNGFGKVITAPVQYAIPFRSLVPLEVDNLLVASRSSGYTSLAAGSARTIPIGMTAGEAAGVASVLSIRKNISPRALSKSKEGIKELQAILIKQGALIYPFSLSYPYEGKWYYPALKKLMPYGFIVAGYENDLKINESLSKKEFLKLLSGVTFRIDPEKYRLLAKHNVDIWKQSNELKETETTISREQVARYYLQFFGYEQEGNPWEDMIKYKLVDPVLANRLDQNRVLTRAEGYQLLAHLVDMLHEGRFDYILASDQRNVGYIDVSNGRTMVPTRFVSEQLKATVDWNNDSKQATIIKDGKVISLKIGQKHAIVDQQMVALDAPFTQLNGTSYVPLRFISEVLGGEVNWVKQLNIVEIAYDEKSVSVAVRKK